MPLAIPFSQLPVEVTGTRGTYLISRKENEDVQTGYMAVLYKARNTRTQELLALKTIWRLQEATQEATAEDKKQWQKAARQFAHEIGVLEQLQDVRGIIQVRDRGIYEDELPWYVMEYIDGPDILQGLAGRSLNEQVRILRQSVEALAQAHKKGIVHRDIKPSNILLRHGDEPVILDFGIAKVVEMAWASISMSTGVCGTLRYMAPEQLQTNAETKDLHQIDIWALAVLFYEILVHHHPLDVNDGDPKNLVIRKILEHEVIDLQTLNENVDRALAEICHKALAKEKAHRYKSAVDMLQALNVWESTNFEQRLSLAVEYARYPQYWDRAVQSALDAHTWSESNKKICEVLAQIFSARYHTNIVVEWMDAATIEWLNSSPQSLLGLMGHAAKQPQCIAKVYYIHPHEPYFIASAQTGSSLLSILKERYNQETGTLQKSEAIILATALEEAIAYASQNIGCMRGLDIRNIFCILTVDGELAEIYFYGLGWKGEDVREPVAVVRDILKSCLSAPPKVPLTQEMETLLDNCASIGEMKTGLQKLLEQEEQAEGEF